MAVLNKSITIGADYAEIDIDAGEYDAVVEGLYPIEIVTTESSDMSVDAAQQGSPIGPTKGNLDTQNAFKLTKAANQKLWARISGCPVFKGPGDSAGYRLVGVKDATVLQLTPC